MTDQAFETRVAGPADAVVIAEVLAEGLGDYRAWACDWQPPPVTRASVTAIADALRRADTWCVLALLGDGGSVGHVALAPSTREDPKPAPVGTINLWQLFIRPAWHGRGVATRLLALAVAEAQRRTFTDMRLWTPQGAGRARCSYEREGWATTGNVHADSPLGLATVEYARHLPEALVEPAT